MIVFTYLSWGILSLLASTGVVSIGSVLLQLDPTHKETALAILGVILILTILSLYLFIRYKVGTVENFLLSIALAILSVVPVALTISTLSGLSLFDGMMSPLVTVILIILGALATDDSSRAR